MLVAEAAVAVDSEKGRIARKLHLSSRNGIPHVSDFPFQFLNLILDVLTLHIHILGTQTRSTNFKQLCTHQWDETCAPANQSYVNENTLLVLVQDCVK